MWIGSFMNKKNINKWGKMKENTDLKHLKNFSFKYDIFENITVSKLF